MNRRTRGVLLVGSLAVATVVTLAVALARGWDDDSCKFHSQLSTTTFPSGEVDVTSWAVTTHCPQIIRRLFGAAASVAAPVLGQATDLPLPEGEVLATERNSPVIESAHAETPLELAAVLGFYRAELSKRGWTENDGAVVEPDRAVVAFTTTDGPAQLRLISQDGRTIADLSLRKGAAADADILPRPGQVRLMLANGTDEEAVFTIDEQTIKLAANAKLHNSPQVDLPPGKFKVTIKVASGGAAQDREFEVGADETWAVLVGPAGVPLPVHIY